MIDKHQPDLLYNDGGLVYPEVGYQLVSHLYNVSAKVHGGKVEAVYTSKGRTDCDTGTCVFDIERGVADQILANPWQTDTCIGNWHYKRDFEYKTPKQVIDLLCDIVSRNGNLMLNFPLPNSGELDSKELKILDEITRWMAVNSEGIYSTRPWKIFGDGPGTKTAAVPDQRFNENSRKDLTAEDVRFTTKGNTLYAFVMGWPGKEASIPALALGGSEQRAQDSQCRTAGPQRKAQVDSGCRDSQGGAAGSRNRPITPSRSRSLWPDGPCPTRFRRNLLTNATGGPGNAEYP